MDAARGNSTRRWGWKQETTIGFQAS